MSKLPTIPSKTKPMKTKHHHLSSLLLCLLGLIPGMAFTEADGAPNRSPELRKVDETHTKQFNDLLTAIHLYDLSKKQVEARLRKIGITWGHGCELSLFSLPEKHRKGHAGELREIAKRLGPTQPKKPPASTNDHGTFCACKDCRKKKKGGSLFPDVENRP